MGFSASSDPRKITLQWQPRDRSYVYMFQQPPKMARTLILNRNELIFLGGLLAGAAALVLLAMAYVPW